MQIDNTDTGPTDIDGNLMLEEGHHFQTMNLFYKILRILYFTTSSTFYI